MATIVGLKELNGKLDKLSKPQVKEAIGKACMVVEAKAKEKCPSDTGLLRDSITSEWNEEEGRIGTNLYYAPYVHQGTGIYAVNGDGRQDVPWVYMDDEGNWHTTSGQQPQPFLADAFTESQEEITKVFEQAIKEAIGK